MGAAFGTAKAGIGIAGIGTFRPDLIMKVMALYWCGMQLTVQSLIPIVMSGILAVYALVISVLIASDIKPPPEKNYSLYAGFCHMAAGLSVGLSGLAAGYAIGIVGDAVGCCCTLQHQAANLSGRALVHAPVAHLCRHGADSHFCRSTGSLRVCIPLSRSCLLF